MKGYEDWLTPMTILGIVTTLVIVAVTTWYFCRPQHQPQVDIFAPWAPPLAGIGIGAGGGGAGAGGGGGGGGAAAAAPPAPQEPWVQWVTKYMLVGVGVLCIPFMLNSGWCFMLHPCHTHFETLQAGFNGSPVSKVLSYAYNGELSRSSLVGIMSFECRCVSEPLPCDKTEVESYVYDCIKRTAPAKYAGGLSADYFDGEDLGKLNEKLQLALTATDDPSCKVEAVRLDKATFRSLFALREPDESGRLTKLEFELFFRSLNLPFTCYCLLRAKYRCVGN